MSHVNNGNCESCEALFNKYPGFYQPLKNWFKALQAAHPEAHISCAGRGKLEQEIYFQRGATRAHWKQSSHNWNAAIDLFQLSNRKAVWDYQWFKKVVKPALTADLKWYGEPDAVFKELPHVEVADYKNLIQQGKLKLVEPA
jgi:hypothetical protein